MNAGTLVRVTSIVDGERVWSYWIVATDNPSEAERAMRDAVPATDTVEASDVSILPETLQRLGLVPGQTWRL